MMHAEYMAEQRRRHPEFDWKKFDAEVERLKADTKAWVKKHKTKKQIMEGRKIWKQ